MIAVTPRQRLAFVVAVLVWTGIAAHQTGKRPAAAHIRIDRDTQYTAADDHSTRVTTLSSSVSTTADVLTDGSALLPTKEPGPSTEPPRPPRHMRWVLPCEPTAVTHANPRRDQHRRGLNWPFVVSDVMYERQMGAEIDPDSFVLLSHAHSSVRNNATITNGRNRQVELKKFTPTSRDVLKPTRTGTWKWPPNFWLRLPNALTSVAAEPNDGHSTPTRVYQTGFVLVLDSCPTNLWHGLYDLLLPLYHTMWKMDALRSPDTVVFVRAGPANIWGQLNRGCPALNHRPYGTDHPFFAAVLRSFLPRPREQIVFYDENFKDLRQDLKGTDYTPVAESWQARIHVNRLVVGVDRGCFPENFPLYEPPSQVEAANSTQPGGNSLSALYNLNFGDADNLSRDQQSDQTECRDVLGQFHDDVRSHSLFGTGSDVVGTAEAQCPVAIVVSRQAQANGRRIINWGAFLNSVRSALPPCATIRAVRLEKLSMTEQFHVVHNSTIFVGTRGAANVLLTAMRSGGAAIIVSGMDSARWVSATGDNFPWYPFPTVRQDMVTALVPCPVVYPSGEALAFAAKARKWKRKRQRRPVNVTMQPDPVQYNTTSTAAPQMEEDGHPSVIAEVDPNSLCVDRSRNFCDVNCSTTDIASIVKSVHDAVSALARRGNRTDGTVLIPKFRRNKEGNWVIES